MPLRPCDHAARVPAVLLVRDPEGASDPVHRQTVCNSSCATEMGTHSALVLVFDKVVDVPVTMLHKFQQSVPIAIELLLIVSSSIECLDIPVMPQRRRKKIGQVSAFINNCSFRIQ